MWEHGRNYSYLNWHSMSSWISVSRFRRSRYGAVTEPRYEEPKKDLFSVSRESEFLLCTCFYGVPVARNLPVNAYIENMLKVLESNKIKFEIFVHAYASDDVNDIHAFQP